jgi:hypothetical protein
MWQHDRGYDHRETEDCSTVVLSADIGRYAADTPLCDVLADLFARWELLRLDTVHGFFVFGLNAFIAPYDPMGTLMGVFGLDAVIEDEGTDTFGLDAVIEAAVPVEQTASFGIDAVINESDAPVAQLVNPIDDNDTVIVITNPDDFPTTCPYLIQIGTETMTVVGGCGTDTLTVVRGSNATAHSAGSIAVIC